MIKIDDASLLDDFESEASAHIETIESAFLDVNALAKTPVLLDSVFRAAHSLKGTAGFFSFKKIVAVAHELESVFSKIQDGTLPVNDEISDLALESVDCLKNLVTNLQTSDNIDINELLNRLKSYSAVQGPEGSAVKFQLPFVFKSTEIKNFLINAAKRGHKIYNLDFGFNKSLEQYYSQPQKLIDDILSVGSIAEATVNEKTWNAPNISGFIAKITNLSKSHKSAVIQLIVTSVLEPDLFLIAVELDSRFVHLIPDTEFKEESEKKAGGQAHAPVTSDEVFSRPIKSANDFSIRLDVSVINKLTDLANEMILTRNQLHSVLPDNIKHISDVSSILQDMRRLTGEIQERVMNTRLQPISIVFGKFPRMIRDMAKSLNKNIQIKLLGTDVALDKFLLDSLSDPIMQLVKNSADHGIEDAGQRSRAGKPKTGTVTLHAYMRDGTAVIEVSDDGAGINPEIIKQAVIERGTLPEQQLAEMTGSDILNLIFEPGFSTAGQITNVSGRGVGMDIVKTNIENLGGSVEIESQSGKGTTIRLKMPLALSVIKSLIIKVNSVLYAIPEVNVERIIRISENTPSRRLEQINNSLALNLNGWLVPIVTSEDIHAKANDLECPSAESLLRKISRRKIIKCLLLKTDNKYFALLIDDAMETEETLVKPLPAYLRHCRCYSHVTILGNGSAIMVIDAEGILRFTGIDGVEKDDSSPESDQPAQNTKPVIIFQCSGTEYFALDADMVLRVERIAPEHIQEIGDGQYINISGKTVQIIRPEDYAPVRKHKYKKHWLYLLIFKTGALSAGILSGKILDKAEGRFDLDNSRFQSDYVLGTSTYREKILIFLNFTEFPVTPPDKTDAIY